MKFSLIFTGEAPDLGPVKKPSPNSQTKANGTKKEKRQESIDKYFTKKSPSKQQQHTTSIDSSQKTVLQKLKEKYKVQNSKNHTLAGKHDTFKQKRKYTKRNLLQTSDKKQV